MTANQADKTNDSDVEKTTENKQESQRSSVAQLRESYRDTKTQLQATTGENRELKEKLASFEEKIKSIEEIKEENKKIQEQLAKQTLEQEKEQQKQQFFEERPHLKEYAEELESNVKSGNFEQDALLYLAKEKPSLLTEEGYNKTKTEKMKVSGTTSNGSTNTKDEADMSPDEYLESMRGKGIEI